MNIKVENVSLVLIKDAKGEVIARITKPAFELMTMSTKNQVLTIQQIGK